MLSLLTMLSQRVMAFFKVSPSDQEGPFYPVVPIPPDANLVHHADGVAGGRHLELKGRVINQQHEAAIGCPGRDLAMRCEWPLPSPVGAGERSSGSAFRGVRVG